MVFDEKAYTVYGDDTVSLHVPIDTTWGPVAQIVAGDDLFLRPQSELIRCNLTSMECVPFSDRIGFGRMTARGALFAAEHTKGGTEIYDLEQGTQHTVATSAGTLHELAFVAGHLCGLRTDGDIEVWRLDGTTVAIIPTSHIHPRTITEHAGQLLVLGERIQAWNILGDRQQSRPTAVGAITASAGRIVSAGTDTVFMLDPFEEGPTPGSVVKWVDTDPTGGIWLGTSQDRITPLQHWFPPTGKITSERPPYSIRRSISTGDGSLLAMTYQRDVLRRTPEGEWLPTPMACWGDMARSADRSRFVCGREQLLIEFNDQGEELGVLAESHEELWAIGLSSNGHELAYATADHEIHLLGAGEERILGPHHDAAVASIEYSPNGRWLATASWDKSIHVYDMRTQALAFTLEGHDGRVTDLAFTTDDLLWSIGWDQSLKSWDLSVLDIAPADHLARIRAETGQSW